LIKPVSTQIHESLTTWSNLDLNVMGYKKQRLVTKLLRAAQNEDRYRDIHVFIGGTGAVGGTALLQMLSMYEEMMSIRAPRVNDVPVLVATGLKREDLQAFTHRLFRFVESRHGPTKLPRAVKAGYLTHSGIFIALERFELTALEGLGEIELLPVSERAAFARSFLSNLGGNSRDPGTTLMHAIAKVRPISARLQDYQKKHFPDSDPRPFRSVTVGIPMPSLVAYHLGHLEALTSYVGLDNQTIENLHQAFRQAFRDDLKTVESKLADFVIVAHTTAVGGMYDEEINGGEPTKKIRLGFAHSAQDTRLIIKQHEAEEFTKEYAHVGINVLITAAAIGIDEVRVRAKIPLHHQIEKKLREAPYELFPGAQKKASTKDGVNPTHVRQFVRVHSTITVPVNSPPSGPASFEAGSVICPTYSIRSGENGFFTVANAEALYRVMRVASASELGLLIAAVGLFGDDQFSPWFLNHVCYYTESDNSRQVFELLNQPRLLQTQLSGLEPMALQDLGSSKHQGELHTLSLLILLHRLRTLNIDAIDPYVDPERFDSAAFFIEHSRALVFEDLENWSLETLSHEMQVLASAERPQDLILLNPRSNYANLFPLKRKALLQILERVLQAVRTVTSIGSPIIYEVAGKTFIRTGYFVAPLDLLMTDHDSIEAWFSSEHKIWLDTYRDAKHYCTLEDFRDYHICSHGFVDLRPIAILCTAPTSKMNLRGRIRRFTDEHSLDGEFVNLEPYTFFTTSGLVALRHRLRSLNNLLQEAMAELGTLHEFRWQMPRDLNGHIILVPGIVEAFRMVAEGLEKTTGTERIDGIWGYKRRVVPERWDVIPGVSGN
jgi:hypothetical protein